MRFWLWERIQTMIRSRQSLRFRTWIELEEIKTQIAGAVREKSHTFPDLIFTYLSTALQVRKEYFENTYWEDVMRLFLTVTSNNPPPHIPLVIKPSTSKNEKDAWDYEGRTWYLYSHLLSKTYGWSLEYIAHLYVKDALTLVQEALTDEQLEKEFLWNMSEKSVSYNAKTKVSKYNELPRPYWMKKEIKPIKVMIMPQSAVPIGVIDESAVPEEFRAKEVKPKRNLEGL